MTSSVRSRRSGPRPASARGLGREPDVLVQLVQQHQNLRVLAQHLGQGGQFLAAVDGARGVARRVQHQPARARRDGGLQRGRRELEALLNAAVHDDRRAVVHAHDVGKRRPVRRRHDDLVARVQRGRQRVVDHLLAAVADDDLPGVEVQAVLAPVLGADGLAQRGRAGRGRVLGFATGQGRDGGLLDGLGRVEIGLARGQRNDVAALAGQGRGPRAGRGIGREPDALHALRKGKGVVMAWGLPGMRRLALEKPAASRAANRPAGAAAPCRD